MADGAIEVKLSLKGRPIREFVFSEPRVTIGRDPQCHIVLDNPGISRCHAELLREDAGFYINDQESANGTFLNDVPVTRAHLTDGDRIRIGKFLLVLKIGAERQTVPAADGERTAFPESIMVLQPAQVDRLLQQTKQAEQQAASRRPNPESARPVPLPDLTRRSTEPVAVGNVLRAPQTSLSRPAAPQTSVAPPPAPPLSLHRTSSSGGAGSHAAAVGAQTSGPASWIRAHIIALEIGFTAGLAVGILIAMTVLG
jgi:predicted component of type VI protein secretion system